MAAFGEAAQSIGLPSMPIRCRAFWHHPAL